VLRTGRVCRVPACESTQERLNRCSKWSVTNSLNFFLKTK
jgi:hypothetical protein